jgi:hypothetical protein
MLSEQGISTADERGCTRISNWTALRGGTLRFVFRGSQAAFGRCIQPGNDSAAGENQRLLPRGGRLCLGIWTRGLTAADTVINGGIMITYRDGLVKAEKFPLKGTEVLRTL